jgi:uncharacterized protein YbbC (DUF1343 family)
VSLLFAAALIAAVATGPAATPPEQAGMSAERLDRIGAAVEDAISRGDLPGAVVLVGRGDAVVFRKAYGHRALEPEREAMTPDTVFDVASLTKPVATAAGVMILVEEGKLRLSDPVLRHLPEFGAPDSDRAKVTVEQLLTHRAGFPPDDPLELYTGSPEEIFARKYKQPLEAPPGARLRYSDVGYEVLGELIRRVSGKPLDSFAEQRIFRPLGMADTHFRPGAGGPFAIPAARIAPTEREGGRWLRGEVHDPRARAVGGVAGHAGLFSTADDLARYCRMILAGGVLGGARVLSPLGVDALTRPRFYGDEGVRALGWDIASPFSSNRGDLFPPGSFGHTGFTGTSLWLDPASKVFVVFLSNRLHPDGKGDVTPLRGIVATLAAASVLDDVRPAARRLAAEVPILPAVKAGIDVLAEDGFRAIAGKRIGLVTNTTGRTRDGRSNLELLRSEAAKKAGVQLALLFAPEHGIGADREGNVADRLDPASGIRVRSLYGESRRPRPEDLSGLGAVLFDVQDVGARFYTYLTTLGYLLEEAAKAGVPVVVLDRPNPINGLAFEGPLADPDSLSFTAYHSIPVRTGMTVGELAQLFNAERRIGAKLTVIPLRGWSRDLWFDETGLPWVNPSPNMRSLTAASLYPGVALLETTNVSVGRGTDTPFEVLGAPWMDGVRLARVLAARQLPGVRFTPTEFTPSGEPLAGKRCGGVRITVVDRDALRPVALGIEIAAALRDLHPTEWDRKNFNRLLADRGSWDRLEKGETAASIVASWRGELESFARTRQKYLLYPPPLVGGLKKDIVEKP